MDVVVVNGFINENTMPSRLSTKIDSKLHVSTAPSFENVSISGRGQLESKEGEGSKG
jgi:hypothetical protein